MRFFKTNTPILFLLINFSIQATAQDWHIYEQKEFGYKVEFPLKPVENQQVVPSAVGDLTMNMATHEVAGTKAYMVIYTLYPEDQVTSDKIENREGFFRGAVDGAVNNVAGTLLSEEDIEIEGYPGREIKVNAQNGQVLFHMKMYLVKNQMFIIQTVTTETETEDPTLARFMSSFKLTEKQ